MGSNKTLRIEQAEAGPRVMELQGLVWDLCSGAGDEREVLPLVRTPVSSRVTKTSGRRPPLPTRRPHGFH